MQLLSCTARPRTRNDLCWYRTVVSGTVCAEIEIFFLVFLFNVGVYGYDDRRRGVARVRHSKHITTGGVCMYGDSPLYGGARSKELVIANAVLSGGYVGTTSGSKRGTNRGHGGTRSMG